MPTTEDRARELFFNYRRANPQSVAKNVLHMVRQHLQLAALEEAEVVRFKWVEDHDYVPDGDYDTEEESEKLAEGDWIAYGCIVQVKVFTGDEHLPELLTKLGHRLRDHDEISEWRDASDVLDPNFGINPPQGFTSAKLTQGEGGKWVGERDGEGNIIYAFQASIMDALWGIVVPYSEGTEFGTYRRDVECDLAANCGLVE